MFVLPVSACTGSLATTVAAPPAAAEEFALAPGQQVVGEIRQYVIRKGDVLADVARRFDIGYTALVAANPGVDPWLPGVGRKITIPSLYILPEAPHKGIVLNLAQYRLFYFPPGGDRVLTYPIGIGVIGWKTPLGTTRVVRKEPHPTWYPPPSIRAQHHAEGDDLPAVVPAGPNNPLGEYALRLGWKNFLIHGTNKPDGVGRNVSHGCIHLYPEDIAHLFETTPVGEPVRTVSQPSTAGWVGNRLYVEIYPSQAQTEEIDTERPVRPDPARGAREIVRAAAGRYADAVDWRAVDQAAYQRTGMPVLVAENSGNIASAQPDPYAAQLADRNAAYASERDAAPPADRAAAQPIFHYLQPPAPREAAQPSSGSSGAPYNPAYGAPGYPYSPAVRRPYIDDAAQAYDGDSAYPYSAAAQQPYAGGGTYPYSREAQRSFERAEQSLNQAEQPLAADSDSEQPLYIGPDR